jgi:hypothetical protein
MAVAKWFGTACAKTFSGHIIDKLGTWISHSAMRAMDKVAIARTWPEVHWGFSHAPLPHSKKQFH